MAGFSNITGDESIMFANNASFDGTERSGKLTTDGQLWIGASSSPHVKKGIFVSPNSSITFGYSSPNITAIVNSSAVGQTITGDTGGALSPTLGNWNIIGSGSTTSSGVGSTLTVQLTGLTNHSVLIGAGTATITKVAPSATSGVPLISQGSSSDPAFGTAVVAGGGTGAVTLTNHGVLIGQGTSAVVATAAGTAGQVLQSGGASADPSYSTATYPSTAGTSGNVLTSDGTNWTSAAPSGGGGWVLIQTQNASTSAAINFTTGITTTYNNYVLVCSNVANATGGTGLIVQISTDGGSNYIATNYSSGANTGVAATTYEAYANTNLTTGFLISPTTSISTTGKFSGVTFLFDMTINNFPTAWSNYSNYSGAVFSMGQAGGVYFNAASVVNALRVISTSGNIASGRFSLYGISQ